MLFLCLAMRDIQSSATLDVDYKVDINVVTRRALWLL